MRHPNRCIGWLARAVRWFELAQFEAQGDTGETRRERIDHVASQGFQKMVGLASPDLHDDLGHLPVVDGVGQTIGGLGGLQRAFPTGGSA